MSKNGGAINLHLSGIVAKDELAQRLVLHLRLPRVLLAFAMGMVLASAGAAMQIIFRNPLVSSGFLGVSQGAAFGAALSILFIGRAPIAIELSATAFALLGLVMCYYLAWNIRYGDWVLRLVLAGIVTSALFSSGVGILKYLADPLGQLPDIVFWLMGGLWSVTWRDVLYTLPVVIPCLTVLLLTRWRLNLLALRDETAFSLGASPYRERGLILLVAVAATAVIVAVAGVVSWVGLIVPHIARRIVGSDAQKLLLDEPTSHLDLANTRHILRLLRELTHGGVTIVFTTHDPNAAATAADYAVLIKGGQIPATGRVEEVFTVENLSQTYGVPVEITQINGRPFVLAL